MYDAAALRCHRLPFDLPRRLRSEVKPRTVNDNPSPRSHGCSPTDERALGATQRCRQCQHHILASEPCLEWPLAISAAERRSFCRTDFGPEPQCLRSQYQCLSFPYPCAMYEGIVALVRGALLPRSCAPDSRNLTPTPCGVRCCGLCPAKHSEHSHGLHETRRGGISSQHSAPTPSVSPLQPIRESPTVSHWRFFEDAHPFPAPDEECATPTVPREQRATHSDPFGASLSSSAPRHLGLNIVLWCGAARWVSGAPKASKPFPNYPEERY